MSEITTVEQLAELPKGTVLRQSLSGAVALAESWLGYLNASGANCGTLTVLYRPDLPPQDELAAERDRLRAAVDAALALHHSRSAVTFPGGGEELECAHCRDEWPCSTRRALDPDKEQP